MKKTPILLSAALLASGNFSAMAEVTARSLASQEKYRSGILSEDPLSGSNLGIVSKDSNRDELFLDENMQDPTFNLLSVDYKQNQIGLQLHEKTGWLIKRVVLAYRNYEGGITEAEADVNIATLGINDDNTWKTLWDYDANGRAELYRYLVPGTRLNPILLTENLTNVIYYAVEYGKKVDVDGNSVWQDLWWSRGKVSYRNCVHASVFNPETMICTRESDGSYQVRKADYTKVDMPVEQIESWDEEWNAVLQERQQKVGEQLSELRDNLYNVLKILDGADEVLDGLKITIPKAENMGNHEHMKLEVERLQKLSQVIREYYLGLNNSSGQEELEYLKQENEGLSLKLEEIRGEKERVEQENVLLKQQLDMVNKDDTAGDIPDNISNATGNETPTVAEDEKKVGVVQELVAVAETFSSAEADRSADNHQNDDSWNGQESTEEVRADVTVPQLGDLKKESEPSRIKWWIVMAGAGIAAMTFLGCKFRNKRK